MNKLLIKFTDSSNSFTCGVEYGRILEQMQQGCSVACNHGFPVHIENIQVLKDTCEEYGYIPYFGIRYYGEWVEFFAIKNTNGNN